MNWIFLPFTVSAITAFCESGSFTCQTEFGPSGLPPCDSSVTPTLNCQKKVLCDVLSCGSGNFYPCGKP